jgi:hypothetical protein
MENFARMKRVWLLLAIGDHKGIDMKNFRRIVGVRSLLIQVVSVLALTLLSPLAAHAQVTIYHVKVTVSPAASATGSTAVYCDTGIVGTTFCPTGIGVWPTTGFGSAINGEILPIKLLSGDTLILAQTGGFPFFGGTAGNFDTSDRLQSSVLGIDSCGGTHTCQVTIELDTTSGGGSATPQLVPVYAATSDALDNFNMDDTAAPDHTEGHDWGKAVSASNLTVQTGYADNAHGGSTFPSPWQGSVTHFLGAGTPMNGTCDTSNATTPNCYDSGAILITAQPVTPPPCTINNLTIANTSWNSFNVPSSKTATVWFHAHIGTPSGIPTNTTTQVRFTNGTLTIVNGTGSHAFTLPDGLMIFNPAFTGTPTTTFDQTTNTWTTTVNPTHLSDELFFDGAAIPVTAALTQGGKATVSFTVQSQSKNLSFSWQWSAAVYTFWPADWNQAQILAYHHTDHAGTPLNTQVQQSLIQGPRGGGGSNFTGSWSATGNGTCTP